MHGESRCVGISHHTSNLYHRRPPDLARKGGAFDALYYTDKFRMNGYL